MTASNEAGGSVSQRLAVELARRDDGLQAGGARVALGELEQRRRDVGGQHVAAGADAARRGQRLLARAGGDVEHAAARADARHVEHRLGGGAEPLADEGPQRCHASAALCHCARVVVLKRSGSKAGRRGGAGGERTALITIS